ncbi:MAG: ferredoxin [bacterium]|nr:ferredoxin [bacterium]
MSEIRKVWIEDGCICCQVCQSIAPQVFFVADGEDCIVLADAAQHFASLQEDIEQAVGDCPVEVIKIDTGDDDA